MITELTEDQKAKLPEYAEKWIKIGLSSGTTDKNAAENAVAHAYRCAGLKPPALFIWTGSPVQNAEAYSAIVALTTNKKAEKPLFEKLQATDPDKRYAFLTELAGAERPDRPSVNSSEVSCYGAMDAEWLGFYDYTQSVLGVDISKINGLLECGVYCDWFIPLESVCIMSRKPTAVRTKRVAGGRHILHAEGRPAIEYPDGLKTYAYEGVELSEKYGALHPSQWNPRWVDLEKNADVRTALLKGIGYERWIQETGGKVVDEWVLKTGEQEIPYKLIFREDPDFGMMKFLHMKNPSVEGVYHVEPVAPLGWIKTCEDALNWRLGANNKDDKFVVKSVK